MKNNDHSILSILAQAGKGLMLFLAFTFSALCKGLSIALGAISDLINRLME